MTLAGENATLLNLGLKQAMSFCMSIRKAGAPNDPSGRQW